MNCFSLLYNALFIFIILTVSYYLLLFPFNQVDYGDLTATSLLQWQFNGGNLANGVPTPQYNSVFKEYMEQRAHRLVYLALGGNFSYPVFLNAPLFECKLYGTPKYFCLSPLLLIYYIYFYSYINYHPRSTPLYSLLWYTPSYFSLSTFYSSLTSSSLYSPSSL